MPSAPPAPDSLPKYLSDGIPKQNVETLEDCREWIDQLLAYRRDVSAEDLDAGDDERIEAVEDSSEGTTVIKKVNCGKDGCKCQQGDLHGPYRYVVHREGDSLSWEYKGPVND